MTEREIDKILCLSRDNLRDHALFHMAFATGFRVSDLLNIKKHDVAPAGRALCFIKIKMIKTGKIVERALPKACQESVNRYLASRHDESPFLFKATSNNCADSDKPMNRSSVHRIIKMYLGYLYSGEEMIGNACHVTRRSIAQIISAKAGRIEPASRFLGHTSIANTVAYLDMDQYGKQADQIVQEMPWNQLT
jgi:integrase